MKKEVYKIKVVLVLLIVILILFGSSSYAAPPATPPSCGNGGCAGQETCSSCPEDCGVCPTTGDTEGDGGGPAPITISIESPKDGETVKREIITILVKGYRGTNPESDIIATAISDLFGEVSLTNNFEQRGFGIYGANVTISKEIKTGNYVILVRGRRGSAVDEHQILITLNPAIAIDTSIKDSYFKGDRIFFEGDLKYFDGSLVKNSSVKLAIFAPGDYFFNISTNSDENGKFAVSYPVSFAEPDGSWDIRITARDKDNNEGSTVLKTKIYTPEGMVFYTVNFLSPFRGAEFKRGSTVPITVEVKDEGELLEKAIVEFKDPLGELTPLQEIRPGVYSLEYKIKPSDPLSVWQIPVQALKTVDGVTKAGGNRITIAILPATLNLVLLEPSNFDFFTGQQIIVRARIAYADGSAVENAKVTAKIGDETIILSEKDSGSYEKKYLFRAKDAAATAIGLFAEDIHGNSIAVPQKAITVRSISKYELMLRLFYYDTVVRYWYLFVSGFIILILITEPFWHLRYLQKKLKKLFNAERRNIEIQKDIQRKYFKHHSISRDNYEKLILKYREDISALKEKKLEVQEKLGKRRFGRKSLARSKGRS